MNADWDFVGAQPQQVMPTFGTKLLTTGVKMKQSITILHLSDLQFGRHHVDETKGRTPLYADNGYDIELEKLIYDVKKLESEIGLPKYIVVSGDIAETSSKNEYDNAKIFFEGLIAALNVPKKNLIIVPGNHDINRSLCQAARLHAKAKNIPFHPPFFSKFEIYQEFFYNLCNFSISLGGIIVSLFLPLPYEISISFLTDTSIR